MVLSDESHALLWPLTAISFSSLGYIHGICMQILITGNFAIKDALNFDIRRQCIVTEAYPF